jgi:D-beta-D-heptose 7-phosphate kinase/D-beta-D-heptose 1-phosphate adenosyltransferase
MKEFFDRIKSLNILVIGDVMLDRYVIGEVKRISPEAPVPVLAVREEKSVAGGAANVALNLKALGANVETIGWFGNDERGDELFDILGRRNIGVDQEFRFSTAPTISKSRVTASNQQICRVDREASTECYSPDLKLLGKDITEKVKLTDAVIISDYGKGFVTNQLLELVSVNAKFLAIDPKPSRLLQYAKPDLITPNRFEALELAGLSRESRDPFPQENVVLKIFEQFAPTMLAVTLGADGMLLAEDGEIDKIIPTSAQEVFDVSGAGDTVIAALTLGLVAGKDFQNAAEFANLAAGVVVGKVGTATVSPEEILSLVD